MKKIFLIFLVGVSFSFAEINEYVSDVYFANGIATDDDAADLALTKIKETFEVSHPDSYKYVANWKVSLNLCSFPLSSVGMHSLAITKI